MSSPAVSIDSNHPPFFGLVRAQRSRQSKELFSLSHPSRTVVSSRTLNLWIFFSGRRKLGVRREQEGEKLLLGKGASATLTLTKSPVAKGREGCVVGVLFRVCVQSSLPSFFPRLSVHQEKATTQVGLDSLCQTSVRARERLRSGDLNSDTRRLEISMIQQEAKAGVCG